MSQLPLAANTLQNTNDYFNIQKQIARLNRPFLYNNTFAVSFVPAGELVKNSNIFYEDLTFLTNSATLPGVNFASTSSQMVGRAWNKTNKYETNNVGLTLYNMDGVPYDIISKWANLIYDKETGIYNFPDDTIINIIITEYTKSGRPKYMHYYEGCNLVSYGTKDLIYGDTNEVQVLQMEVDFRTYRETYL